MPQRPIAPAPDISQIIGQLRVTWQAGRRVVPIVGAGISADSGFPTIVSLMRYFGKFHELLRQAAYLPPPAGGTDPEPLRPASLAFQARPSDFVKAVGWPDRFDLNQSLFDFLRRTNADRVLTDCVNDAYDDIIERVNPNGEWDLTQLQKQLGLTPAPGQKWADGFRLDGKTRKHVPFGLLADWRRVIQHFTGHQGDYADALFHRLGGARHPSGGHLHLAFLVRLLSVRTIFTFNFDDLIERALRREGVLHRAFAMEYGSGLPHPTLLYDVRAVVKMHGGTHSLLLDERLDYPLDAAYKARFREIVGAAPFYLVLGCSGERRLLDLLHTVIEHDPRTKVAWVHFDTGTPTPVTELCGRHPAWARDNLYRACTNNLGQTLQHIQTALTGRHPVSPRPYAVHTNRPLLAGDEPVSAVATAVAARLADNPRVALSTFRGAAGEYRTHTASEVLLELAAVWTRKGYTPIWVNLESCHTLAAVASSIIDQCRAIDTVLTPSVLNQVDRPRAGETESAAKALRRVVEALRRSRYLVLCDGLEAYLWPPTAHHGEPPDEPEAEHRWHALVEFLTQPTAQGISESKVVLGMDRPETRQHPDGGPVQRLERFEEQLRAGTAGPGGWMVVDLTAPEFHLPGLKFADVFHAATGPGLVRPDLAHPDLRGLAAGVRLEGRTPAAVWGMAFLMLSVVRRARDLVLCRHLLKPVFGTGTRVDGVLNLITAAPAAGRLGLRRLAHGGVWYLRPVRDYVYSENSKHAIQSAIDDHLRDAAANRPNLRAAAAQLLTLVACHQWAARGCHSAMYLPSQDAMAFLEYVYHRVSALRYLRKLVHVLARPGAEAEALEGVRAAVAVFRGALTEKGFQKVLRLDPFDGAAEGGMTALPSILGGETDPPATAAAVIADLRRLHLRELAAMTQSWVRAEPALRTQLPAEQVLFWCERLIQFDAPRIGLDGEAERPALAAFTDVLKDFMVKLKFERSDFAGAIQDRLNQVLRALIGPTFEDIEELRPRAYLDRCGELEAHLGSDFLNRFDVRQVHNLLDVVVCCIQQYRSEQNNALESSDPIGAEVGRLLNHAEAALARLPGGDTNDWERHEAELRVLYMKAEIRLGDVTVFAQRTGLRGRPWNHIHANERAVNGLPGRTALMQEAEGFIARGLSEVRGRSSRADGRLRSLILEPAANGSIHVPYRAAFRSLNGRLKWLMAVRDEAFDTQRSSADAIEQLLESGFEEAFQSFDLAGAGLQGGNSQIAATNEIYRVEACLARARIALYPQAHAPNPVEQIDRQIGLATAKCEAARVGLQRARELLNSGRRNVIWWKFFYTMAAQYQSEQLLLALVTALRGGAIPPIATYNRLRRGYSAIKAAYDLQLPHDTHVPRWLRRAWQEATAAGYCLGRLYLARYLAALEQRPAAGLGDAEEAVLRSYRQIGAGEPAAEQKKRRLGWEDRYVQSWLKALNELEPGEAGPRNDLRLDDPLSQKLLALCRDHVMPPDPLAPFDHALVARWLILDFAIDCQNGGYEAARRKAAWCPHGLDVDAYQ